MSTLSDEIVDLLISPAERMASASPKTWLVVGASRGIGHEFVRQSLDRGDRVFATVRNGKKLDSRCTVLECDVLSEKSIGVGQDP